MPGFVFPKITLGKDQKRSSEFNLSHSVHGSLQFGEVIPAACFSVIPGSSLNLKNFQKVRLGTMPLPTMDHLSIRNYFQFCPIEDVFPTWANLVTGDSIKNTILSNVPVFQTSDLYLYFLTHLFPDPFDSVPHGCSYSVYEYKNSVWNYCNNADALTATQALQNTSNCPAVFKFSDGSVSQISGYSCTNNEYYRNNSDIISPNSADFQFDFVVGGARTFKICFRYSLVVRRLIKICEGIGYRFDITSSDQFSFLPILAFYKVWYDIHGNQQQKPYTDTNAYKISNGYLSSPVAEYTVQSFISDLKNSNTSLYLFFNNDLVSCYYMADIDYITAHQSTPVIATGESAVSLNTVGGMNTYQPVQVGSTNVLPQTNPSSPLTAAAIQLLLKLSRDVNKNSIIGKRINTYLKVHGLGSSIIEQPSYRIGSAIANVDISAVLATADNVQTDTVVGQYSGIGISHSENGFHFEASKYGYLFVLQCVVPHTGWCQGVDLDVVGSIHRYDFYDGNHDAVGLTITPKSVINGQRDYISSFESNSQRSVSQNFGLIPRYTEKKVKPDKIMGNFTLRSTRTGVLPFSLLRYIDREPCDFREVSPGSHNYTQVQGFVPGTSSKAIDLPVADPSLRYIGEIGKEWIGNFNRIFTVSGVSFDDPLPDQFIIHNKFKVKYVAPMLSISNSYDTDELNALTLGVEKA